MDRVLDLVENTSSRFFIAGLARARGRAIDSIEDLGSPFVAFLYSIYISNFFAGVNGGWRAREQAGFM